MINPIKKISFLFLSFILLSTGYSQNFNYPGPGFDEAFLFPIGWSNDGKRLAYGMFTSESNAQVGDDIYSLKINVLDLVSDAMLWQVDKSWFGSDADHPGSAKDAWNTVNQETPEGLNAQIESYGIGVLASSANFTGSDDDQICTIPLSRSNDEITLIIYEEDAGEEIQMGASISYEIEARSRNLGEKKIAEGRIPSYCHVYIRGYMFNPDESRIAIILHKRGHFNHPEFDIITSAG